MATIKRHVRQKNYACVNGGRAERLVCADPEIGILLLSPDHQPQSKIVNSWQWHGHFMAKPCKVITGHSKSYPSHGRLMATSCPSHAYGISKSCLSHGKVTVNPWPNHENIIFKSSKVVAKSSQRHGQVVPKSWPSQSQVKAKSKPSHNHKI